MTPPQTRIHKTGSVEWWLFVSLYQWVVFLVFQMKSLPFHLLYWATHIRAKHMCEDRAFDRIASNVSYDPDKTFLKMGNLKIYTLNNGFDKV